MEEKHLPLTCTLTVNNQEILTHALINCGSYRHCIYALWFCSPSANTAPRGESEASSRGHRRKTYRIKGYHTCCKGGDDDSRSRETATYVHSKLRHIPIILGIPLLRSCDVAVLLASNMVTFGPQNSATHCPDAPVPVQGVREQPLDPVHPKHSGIFEPKICPQRPFRRNILTLHGSSFVRRVKKGKIMESIASLYKIDEAIEANDLEERHLEEIVPKQYHESLRWCNMVSADCLTPHRPGIDYEVCLREAETPIWWPLQSMSRAELVALEEWLEENMSKGFIRQSSSPLAASLVIAMMSDGGLWFCIE